MKLYVWENVLTDYTSGMVVVLARDDDEAAAKLQEQGYSDICEGLVIDGVEPEIIDPDTSRDAVIWYVYGGS